MKPNELHPIHQLVSVAEYTVPTLLNQSHPDWQSFISQYNVAVPERKEYRTGPVVFSLRCFLGFSKNEAEDFVGVNKQLHKSVTDEFAVVALTTANDLVLMNHDTGWIYFGRKEEVFAAADEETLLANLFYLSGSLSDFIGALKNPPRNRKTKLTHRSPAVMTDVAYA